MSMKRTAPDVTTALPSTEQGVDGQERGARPDPRLAPPRGLAVALVLVLLVLVVGGRAGLSSGDELNALVGPAGRCDGRDPAGYPNGRIPESALCQEGRTDHGEPVLLRADAAAALSALAAAWEADHGTPLCIRSAYRSYDEQAELVARMPELAAPPGESAHGWGTALDLCGGIADASSPQQVWMARNAPRHGWVQPEWAQPQGSRPEPWHWEYEHGPRTYTGGTR
jgi:hypothetical protein